MEECLNTIQSLPLPYIYFALGFFCILENLIPPVPGDTVLVFGAFLVGKGVLNLLWVCISTILGTFLGFMLLFWVGIFLRDRFLKGDVWFFKRSDIERAIKWFERYGYLFVLINRFLPGIRSVISISAGITKLRPSMVAIYCLIGSALWNGIWIYMGYLIGKNWQFFSSAVSDMIKRYQIAILILLCIAFIFYLFKKRFFKR